MDVLTESGLLRVWASSLKTCGRALSNSRSLITFGVYVSEHFFSRKDVEFWAMSQILEILSSFFLAQCDWCSCFE